MEPKTSESRGAEAGHARGRANLAETSDVLSSFVVVALWTLVRTGAWGNVFFCVRTTKPTKCWTCRNMPLTYLTSRACVSQIGSLCTLSANRGALAQVAWCWTPGSMAKQNAGEKTVPKHPSPVAISTNVGSAILIVSSVFFILGG